MKTLIAFLVSCCYYSITPVENITPVCSDSSGTIVVNVDKIVKDKGTLYVGIFNSKRTFRKIKKVYKYQQVPTSETKTTVTLEDVPFDEYALVVFQDFNENRKFDKNFMGLPKEPFGFSTNFVVSTRAPKYRDVTFQHGDTQTVLDVFLQSF